MTKLRLFAIKAVIDLFDHSSGGWCVVRSIQYVLTHMAGRLFGLVLERTFSLAGGLRTGALRTHTLKGHIRDCQCYWETLGKVKSTTLYRIEEYGTVAWYSIKWYTAI